MKTFYTDNAALVYYDEILDTLFLEYKGRVLNDAHFIQINTAVLEAFKKLTTQKFIADIRKMGIIGLKSQSWVVEVLLPGMVEHLKGRTLFHAQLLDASEVMSKVSGANIKNKSSESIKNLVVRQFTNVEEMNQVLKTWRG